MGAAHRTPSTDPATVLGKAFKPKRVPPALLAKMVTVGVSETLAGQLSTCPAFKGSKDVAGLITLRHHEVSDQDIAAWARCGSLDAAWRLSSMGVSVTVAGPVIVRTEGATSSGYLRVMQAANTLGVRAEDVPFWVSAGVFRLTGHHPVDQGMFAAWRSFAVGWVGMRQAALVAAAGITIKEAIGMRERGEYDGAVVKIMAQLNL